jgi:hypothetical protein
MPDNQKDYKFVRGTLQAEGKLFSWECSFNIFFLLRESVQSIGSGSTLAAHCAKVTAIR